MCVVLWNGCVFGWAAQRILWTDFSLIEGSSGTALLFLQLVIEITCIEYFKWTVWFLPKRCDCCFYINRLSVVLSHNITCKKLDHLMGFMTILTGDEVIYSSRNFVVQTLHVHVLDMYVLTWNKIHVLPSDMQPMLLYWY